jgi:hypothetical protein
MNIKDFLRKYSHPDCALTPHLIQDCPFLDLKSLRSGAIRLICDVILIRSIRILKSGPEYYYLI